MMFVIHCLDKPDHNDVRLQYRQAHRDWLAGQVEKIVGSGPLLDDDGLEVLGSLIIIKAESKEAAEVFAGNDPYHKAGLFRSVSITRWQKVLPV